MDDETLVKIGHLNDIELTILASLISGNHCLFSVDDSDGLDLFEALQSTCRNVFELEPASLHCDAITTIDELNESLLQSHATDLSHASDRARADSLDKQSVAAKLASNDDHSTETKALAKAVILHHLDKAPNSVQAQMIELLRTTRMFTRDSMYTAPGEFIMIATLSTPGARLSYHLNDMIASSNRCGLQDNPEGLRSRALLISHEEVEMLRLHTTKVRLTAEVDAYLYDLVLCMRMSRYVQGGVSATATRQMRILCKALATIHGIDFVTPSLVMLAARQIYPHRLVLATAATEKSLQWGSDPVAVQHLLEGRTTAEVIDDVIASVETPL